jgi:protein-S-isoprenylcysteine O-methyltransferase Ste14
LLRRLNDLAIFDAARWPAREVVGRILGCLLAVGFIAGRILRLPNSVGYIRAVRWAEPWFATFSSLPKWLVPPAVDLEAYYFRFGYSREQVTLFWALSLGLWAVITGSFIAYLIAYLTRAKAQSVAKGFLETAFPVIVAALPLLTVLTRFTYRDWFPEHTETHMTGLYVILSVLIAGGLLHLIGLLGLRRGFTIMSEARVLIRTGLHRWIRHPIYTSHFLINLCFTLLYFHATTVALYALFVAGQTLRARTEERKLAAVFPEYEEYRRTTGMFFPRLWRRAL